LAQKAADQGEVAAYPLLARAYAEGRGVVRNDIQAQTWRLLSRSQRYIEGPTFDALDARLTPAARREARKRADAWLKSHRP
jgi:TPR repeat protein